MDIPQKCDQDSLPMCPYIQPLIDALKSREAIISDHEWRDRDSAAHLNALKEVSERIGDLGRQWSEDPSHPLPARLRHFLEGCSYQKARAFLESGDGACR